VESENRRRNLLVPNSDQDSSRFKASIIRDDLRAAPACCPFPVHTTGILAAIYNPQSVGYRRQKSAQGVQQHGNWRRSSLLQPFFSHGAANRNKAVGRTGLPIKDRTVLSVTLTGPFQV